MSGSATTYQPSSVRLHAELKVAVHASEDTPPHQYLNAMGKRWVGIVSRGDFPVFCSGSGA